MRMTITTNRIMAIAVPEEMSTIPYSGTGGSFSGERERDSSDNMMHYNEHAWLYIL